MGVVERRSYTVEGSVENPFSVTGPDGAVTKDLDDPK
jgi:hypothetical protein